MAYAAHASVKLAKPTLVRDPKVESALKKIFILLRAQTGHDFSQYKPSTIYRRIERRMVVHQIDAVDSYVKYLQQTPTEVEALFRDLLIGVTHFFRDPEAFQALEDKAIPKLFDDKSAGGTVRVWCAGCSTGEEAYSIAILLQERLEALKQSYTLQVFATDIDSRAIATARTGIYPLSIASDITPQRLARFFTSEPHGGGYRVNKGIRDMLVFSEQDVLKDPPFSRLDLLTCRNLLIYLDGDLQKRLIPLFHYALNASGMLFLGTSEGVGDFHDLFTTLDRKAKLYQRKANSLGIPHASPARFMAPVGLAHSGLAASGTKLALSAKLPLRELTEQALLNELAPPSALVNRAGDILYSHGRTGLYLELAAGEPGISNILKMAREGLRHALTTALHKAASSQSNVDVPGLRVKTNGHHTLVDLRVSPVAVGEVPKPESSLYLVMLQEALAPAIAVVPEPLPTGGTESASGTTDSATAQPKGAPEPVEPETRDNDMNNLLAGTGIATIFVDHSLRILRFTPSMTQIINLIPSDAGRPVGHTVTNLVNYSHLVDDVQRVLDTLVPKEVEVKTTAGKWYMLRILPYRTLNNVIEGAVLLFVDINEIVKTRDALVKTNELLRLAVVVRDARDAITVQDLEGRTLAWNPGAVRMFGWTEAQALAMNVRERIPAASYDAAKAQMLRLSRGDTLAPYAAQRLTKDGDTLAVQITATALINQAGEVYAIATTEREQETSL